MIQRKLLVVVSLCACLYVCEQASFVRVYGEIVDRKSQPLTVLVHIFLPFSSFCCDGVWVSWF